MKSWQNHIRASRSLLLTLTTTLLLFVACGPAVQWLLSSSDSYPSEFKEIVQQQKNSDTNQDESKNQDTNFTKVSTVSEAVIPITKFHIAFCCSFIRTFSLIEKVVRNETFEVPLPQSHYFRTLFRQIISPNAP